MHEMSAQRVVSAQHGKPGREMTINIIIKQTTVRPLM